MLKEANIYRAEMLCKIPGHLEDLTGFEILRRDEDSRVWMGACAHAHCQFSTSGIYEA